MEITAAIALLDKMPTSRSDYEFKNFNLELHGTFPRQLRAMLMEKEQLTDELTEILAEIEIVQLETGAATGAAADAVARRNAARVNQLSRHMKGLKQKLKQVDDWLDSQEIDQCETAVAEFEESESEHWTDHLGRLGAIEVLSQGRTRADTMVQLSQLPLGDYKKAVTIVAQLANFLKDTAEQAESALFPQQDQLPGGAQVAE